MVYATVDTVLHGGVQWHSGVHAVQWNGVYVTSLHSILLNYIVAVTVVIYACLDGTMSVTALGTRA